MQDKVREVESISAKISPALGEFAAKFGQIYSTAGVICEKAGESTIPASSLSDFTKKVSQLENDAYKLPADLKEYGQALAALAPIFSFATIQAGKLRSEQVSGFKDSCDMFMMKVINKSSDDKKATAKQWRMAVLAVASHVEAHCKGQTSSGAAAAPAGGLFASLNKGEGVTQGLRKVDDSEKTHKNPGLRSQAPIASKAPEKSGSSCGASVVKGDPVFKKDGDTYVGKFLQKEEKKITGPAKTKAFMSSCSGTKFIIEDKINSFFLENCTDCVVQVKSGLIATMEASRCSSCHVQCDIAIPMVQFDSCSNCMVYVKESELTHKDKSDQGRSMMQVITCKCDSININHLDDSMYHKSENPVPSIFCSTFDQVTKKWSIQPQVV